MFTSYQHLAIKTSLRSGRNQCQKKAGDIFIFERYNSSTRPISVARLNHLLVEVVVMVCWMAMNEVGLR